MKGMTFTKVFTSPLQRAARSVISAPPPPVIAKALLDPEPRPVTPAENEFPGRWGFCGPQVSDILQLYIYSVEKTLLLPTSQSKVSCQAQWLSEHEGGSLARRRYQPGNVESRGDRWVGRWREDIIGNDGVVRRQRRCLPASMRLATDRGVLPHLESLRKDGRTSTVPFANPLLQGRKHLTCAFTSSRRSVCCGSMRLVYAAR